MIKKTNFLRPNYGAIDNIIWFPIRITIFPYSTWNTSQQTICSIWKYQKFTFYSDSLITKNSLNFSKFLSDCINCLLCKIHKHVLYITKISSIGFFSLGNWMLWTGSGYHCCDMITWPRVVISWHFPEANPIRMPATT